MQAQLRALGVAHPVLPFSPIAGSKLELVRRLENEKAALVERVQQLEQLGAAQAAREQSLVAATARTQDEAASEHLLAVRLSAQLAALTQQSSAVVASQQSAAAASQASQARRREESSQVAAWQQKVSAYEPLRQQTKQSL